MDFGKNLREAIAAKGVTQRDLAAQIGVKQAAVSLWINDRRRPDFETLLALCRVLDVSPNDLLEWSEEEKRSSTK